MDQKYQQIVKKLGKGRVKAEEPMSKHTTFGIGGPADLFYEAKTTKQLTEAVKLVRQLKVPYFILGKGSNILVSDDGIRGLVIKNLVIGLKIIERKKEVQKTSQKISARHFAAHPKRYLKFSDLDYPNEPFTTEVVAHSGTPLQHLIQWSFENQLTGLQWFAGIPGTVGGAVIFNIHGGSKIFSDYIEKLTVLDENDKVREVKRGKVKFDYDFSDLSNKGMTVLKVNLRLSSGDLKKAIFVYREWRKRKLPVQPQKNTPGCVFKNFLETEAKKVGAPTPGAGWYIDQCGLKGKQFGQAQISPKHANFIVNLGGAKAGDVLKLMELAKAAVKKKFGLELEEEIHLVGFDTIT